MWILTDMAALLQCCGRTLEGGIERVSCWRINFYLQLSYLYVVCGAIRVKHGLSVTFRSRPSGNWLGRAVRRAIGSTRIALRSSISDNTTESNCTLIKVAL